MKQIVKPVQGFLLIEFVTSLALIGLLVTFVSLFLAQGIETRHDITMRLQALDAATTRVERLSLGLPQEKIDVRLKVTVDRVQNTIGQDDIDRLIPLPFPYDQEKRLLNFYVVTVAWQSYYGIERSVRLLTALEANFMQEVS